tara:strand:- start:3390 stop:4346 length:957 start_codon:yes stop_codon:yes gene_type:complete
MSFISSTKFVLQFNDSSLTEEVNEDSMVVQGSGSTDLLENNLGYSMKLNQYLQSSTITMSISTSMSIGFWLNSTNPGVVRNAVGVLDPLRVSLFDIRDLNNDEIIFVYEKSQINNKNRLEIKIGDAIITSSEYEVGNWHHFWITYDGSTPEIKLFIDAKEDSTSMSGAIPDNINGSRGRVSINRQALGFVFDVVNNQGDVDDVVVLNVADSSDATLQRVINHSLSFAFDTIYMNNEEISQAFLFNDPDVFSLTSVSNDSTSVLATRSDGKIFEGSPTMWQVRKRFRTEEETKSLNISGVGFSATNGLLDISGVATVKV